MTQLLGPDEDSRLGYRLVSSRLNSTVGLTATIYTNAAGTTLAAINTYDGTTTPGALIAGSTVVVNIESKIPLFWFPAGATVLYARIGSGPVSPIKADDGARIGRLRTASFNMSPAAGVVAALDNGASAVIQLVGDSTSDVTTEWFGVLGSRLGALYPGHNVAWRQWNAATQNYDPPISLQAGPLGDRYITVASASLTSVAPAITGDLEIRAKLLAADWTPASQQIFAGRYESTGNQRGFFLALNTAGTLVLQWTTDGTGGTAATATSTAAVPFADGAVGWVRCTLDVDNGAAGRDVKFYTSADGIAWTQLGTTVTSGVTSIHASTAPYQIGSSQSSFASAFAGRIYWIEILNGIDGPSVVPPLPGDWDQASSSSTSTVLPGGSPTLLLINGSEGGRNIAYWDDATRRPKAFSQQGQHLVILSTNHNEAQRTGRVADYFMSAYTTWVTNIKALLPGVPIVALTQNPEVSPVNGNNVYVRMQRSIALTTWARSQVGVYALNTFPAFTDTATQINAGDGVHPTVAGSAVWADYVYGALFS